MPRRQNKQRSSIAIPSNKRHNSRMSGKLIVIAAPSGAGKTTLVHALVKCVPYLIVSVSFTTRPPRPGDRDGVDYHFINQAAFQDKIERNDFLEWAEVYGNYYGTSASWVGEQLAAGNDVILEIDWQGADAVRQRFPEHLSVYILPPSLAVLRGRIEARNQDCSKVIEARMQAAKDDISHADEFDVVLVNQDFDETVLSLAQMIDAWRHEEELPRGRHEKLVAEMLETN